MDRTLIRSSAREIIYKIFKRCLAELEAGKILFDSNDVYKRIAEMTSKMWFKSNKCVSTIRRIALETQINKVFSPHQGNVELGDLEKNWMIGHVMKIESDYYQRVQALYNDIDKIISEDNQNSTGVGSRQDVDRDSSGVEYLDESIFDSA